MTALPKHIPFIQNDIDNLEKELSKSFVRLSLLHPNKSTVIDSDRWASSVTLWTSDQQGLQIKSRMCDVAERTEVGVLSFGIINEINPEEVFYSLSKSFSNGTKFLKLIVNESGNTLESGLKIVASNGDQIIIVPNAMPYSLAISSTGMGVEIF